MSEELLLRSQVPVDETWDLSAIYATDADMEQDLAAMEEMCAHMCTAWDGHLDTAENIAACLNEYRAFVEKEATVEAYASLAVSVDYYDTDRQKLSGRVMNRLAQMHSALKFIPGQITRQPGDVLAAALDAAGSAAGYLREIIRSAPHQLHPEAERVLAAYAPVLGLPYEAYNAAKLADMRFAPFAANGKEYPLGYSLFEDNYEYEADTAVRRGAFRAFSEKLRQYENVTAAAYNACVQADKIAADLRGFDNVFDYLLFDQQVTREMYDRQIDMICEKLAPHMRRYARLIQRLYGLDKMTFADLKLPLDAGYDPEVSIEGSKAYIEKGLAILGEDYVEMVRDAYAQRWVDFARNQGKSTGGFCASPYGRHSYILLNWNGRMSDVFTLAHELGHAGHFKRCNAAQSIFDTNVSTYFVEAPSTCNELFMAHYLLSTDSDPRFRRWVLSCMVSNTYYHNFVTHLLEAAYQREVYRIVDAGGSVEAQTLSALKRKVLEDFWGDDVEITDGAELTWMRQPHYYMGLYSYTYSAGLTVATQAVKRIEREGHDAVEDWKRMLSAGSTAAPAELAAMAGVDITTGAALEDTIDTIGAMIDEIIALTDALEKE